MLHRVPKFRLIDGEFGEIKFSFNNLEPKSDDLTDDLQWTNSDEKLDNTAYKNFVTRSKIRKGDP